MSDNKENHPFDEEALRDALSESLQSAATEHPAADGRESETPLFDRDTGTAQTKGEGLDDELSYGDLAEAWQEEPEEEREEYLPEDDGGDSEEEMAMEETHDEPIRTFQELGASEPPTKSADKSVPAEGGGISRIVIGIIVLCVIGFTASNWMTSRKVDALVTQLEETQTRLNAMSQKLNRLPAETTSEAANQANEAMLAQLAASIVENRETIDSVKQSLETIALSKRSEPQPEIPAAPPAKAAAPIKQTKQPAKATAKPAPSKKVPGWSVVLMSLKNEAMADEELAALRTKGIQAEKHAVQVKGETYHQLRVGRFAQKDDALAYSKELAGTMGYKGAWVSAD